MRTPLATIVRGFGVEPDAIRFIRKRYNTYWLVRAGSRRYVLRRFGVWKGAEDDPAWEIAWVERMAAAGLPVPAPIGGSRVVGGAVHMLMPYLPGRPLRGWGSGSVSDAHYRVLGRHMADFHAAIAHLPLPPQRPGWCEAAAGVLPRKGGRERRAELLAAVTQVDARLGARFTEAAERLDARDLPGVFAGAPRIVVQADFSPWNVRVRGGRMVGLIDFELAHVDVAAADIAQARRGYHDAVVDGYLERATLSDAELAALDGLWLAGMLAGTWRVLEDRLALGEQGADLIHDFEWTDAQLDKTRPYLT